MYATPRQYGIRVYRTLGLQGTMVHGPCGSYNVQYKPMRWLERNNRPKRDGSIRTVAPTRDRNGTCGALARDQKGIKRGAWTSSPRLNPPLHRRCPSYVRGRASVGAYGPGCLRQTTRGPRPTSETMGRLDTPGDASRWWVLSSGAGVAAQRAACRWPRLQPWRGRACGHTCH